MVLVWRGWGPSLLFIASAALVLFPMAVRAALGEEYWVSHQSFLGGLAGVLAGLLGLTVRLALLKTDQQSLTDPETGQTHIFRLRHELFWIDIKWWSVLIAALGIFYMITGKLPWDP